LGSADRSWAFSLFAAWIAFAVLVLAFGVIPSEFIGWFNKRWNDPNLQSFVRDPIVVVYHIVVFGAMIVGSVKYQERREKKLAERQKRAEHEAAPDKEPAVKTSAFGRPLVKAR
jgi:fumarate reductase subunit C